MDVAPAISTQGLTRRFGQLLAVDGVNLRVAPGQFFGFLGPNGAGKSTTIRMLTGLLAPSSGRINNFGGDGAPHQDSSHTRHPPRMAAQRRRNLASNECLCRSTLDQTIEL
jgi:ABC-type multidrug transport system ATPase subunit